MFSRETGKLMFLKVTQDDRAMLSMEKDQVKAFTPTVTLKKGQSPDGELCGEATMSQQGSPAASNGWDHFTSARAEGFCTVKVSILKHRRCSRAERAAKDFQVVSAE